MDVNANLGASGLVLDIVETKFVKNFPIFPVDLEFFAEQELALGIEIDEDLFKIIVNFPSIEGAQWILDGSLGDDMWGIVLHRGWL